eukprot:CAMPEP_0180210456 /NCGR_PEP_ID=MMETSP0987-20121128/12150_1 /TAXON_ID=697907 /ORGANISM="non described non described, Strain CCMP2293" /LENGTH=96 /DNA_ID=CAMNT_0022167405 /DNA_START=174 /DNA_END=460 /DNA_ORIENTATION=-
MTSGLVAASGAFITRSTWVTGAALLGGSVPDVAGVTWSLACLGTAAWNMKLVTSEALPFRYVMLICVSCAFDGCLTRSNFAVMPFLLYAIIDIPPA